MNTAHPEPHEIKVIRKHKGWTQADFAWYFGLHPMTVSKWERAATRGTLCGRLARNYETLLAEAVIEGVEP